MEIITQELTNKLIENCIKSLECEDPNGIAIRDQKRWDEIRTGHYKHLDYSYAIRESLAAEIIEKAMEIHYGKRCENCYARLAESHYLQHDGTYTNICLECAIHRGTRNLTIPYGTHGGPISVHLAEDHKYRQYLEVLCVSCDKILNIGKRFPDSEFPRLVCLRCGSSVELHATFDEHT